MNDKINTTDTIALFDALPVPDTAPAKRPDKRNLAFALAAKRVGIKPGSVNRRICVALKRDGTKCGNLALTNCERCQCHAPRAAAKRRAAKQVTRRKATKIAPAPAPPPELQAQAVWRECVGQRERNMLAHAWVSGDAGAWRKAVHAVKVAREQGEQRDDT